jgi:hypothetical protein
MNPRLRKTPVVAVVGVITFILLLSVNPDDSESGNQIRDDYKTLRTQYGLRSFAIDRWNKSFIGAGTGRVNVGPFVNQFGEKVAVEISTTDFNPGSDQGLPEGKWRKNAATLFGDLSTEAARNSLCQMFYSGLMYPEYSLGSYFANHRIELKNLGLIPYSFDEIEMNGDFRNTIKYPTSNIPQTLFRCSASGVFIKSSAGYSPPFRTSVAWQYTKNNGLIKAQISLSLLTQ